MAALIQNPAKFEVLSVICFVHAKGQQPADIHKEIVSVYGNIMNRQNVTKWCRHFSEGRTDVHDEQRTGRSSVISDAFLQKTEEAIHANRRLKLKELHQIIPELSMTTLYEVVTVKLGYRELCVRWVPKMLTEEHKKKMMALHSTSSHAIQKQGDELLDHIVTDRQGILLLEFIPPGTTINAAAYCQTLKRFQRAIKNKRRGMLTNGVSLLHDNARLLTALVTKALLKQFKWEVLDHPPYSPDLAPSDFHLFRYLKSHGGKSFHDDDEIKDEVEMWLRQQATTFYDYGIQKPVHQLNKCLDNGGDYVEI
ncbi:histone-lysine N-methyltransferase SETMAR [Trichonephila clavipes]|nr:histone-lysine N-methyltransferase SETMAR [Trichonephila clavipes]